MKTGATTLQIIDAVMTGLDHHDDPNVVEIVLRDSRMSITEAAELLVPPGKRIIDLDDLMRLRSLWSVDGPPLSGGTLDFIKRIDALIAGEEEG